MAVKTLFRNISQLVCVEKNAAQVKVGAAMNDLCVIDNAAMLVDDTILWIGPDEDAQRIVSEHVDQQLSTVDCQQKCIMPGFVDSHTHIVFAGNRSHEFARRLQGVSYQQIASEGGGILSTVQAVRDASLDELVDQGRRLALSALAHGTTTIEIKSGYALSTESELKMLRAISILRNELPLNVYRTFLGAHDFPPEYSKNHDAYVSLICNEMIPSVQSEDLAEFCDVFCDTGYYTVDQSEKILNCAASHGMQLKVHADELSGFGAAEMAARLHAVSADHLLFVSDEGIEQMVQSKTVVTLLPGTAYTLGLPYAPARKMIEKGSVVALATDCNPGSCFNENMQTVLSLACSNMKMSIEQSIVAATLHGAAALKASAKIGSLEIGKRADFLLLDCDSYSDLVYHFGVNHVHKVWIGGQLVHTNAFV